MEPALKQRLLGAAVLVALAVTFLPMLVMDPAPESGASDVPLRVPPAPAADIETRELPLVGPAPAAGPALAPIDAPGSDVESDPGEPVEEPSGMLPAPTAGGDFAVSFGSYATAADAARVVAALRASQLPGYADAVASGARTLHRVRIGPYATRAEAEAARLRAAHVRDDVGARVVALDADAATATPPPAAPARAPATRTVATAARPASPAPGAPASPAAAAAAPAPPAASTPAEPAPRTAAPSVGFAVQLGAFANVAEAQRLQDRARSAGFPAFVEPVRTDGGTLHRVRIGPVADRAAADALRTRVAGRLGISGIVRPHP